MAKRTTKRGKAKDLDPKTSAKRVKGGRAPLLNQSDQRVVITLQGSTDGLQKGRGR